MVGLLKRSKSAPKGNKAEAENGAAPKGSDANCVVAKGTRIDGDFSSVENIRLDGVLTGQLQCKRRLVIGGSGRVEGKVSAADAVVMGQIMGDVTISGTLKLTGTARIEGDIQAKFLTVEEGAAYIGNCRVGAG